MYRRNASRTLRTLASFLALALIHAAFGPQAWSQVAIVGSVSVPVKGSAAAAVNVYSPAHSAAPTLSLSNAGLTGSLSAPSIVPTSLPLPSAVTPNAFSARTSAIPAALAPIAVSVAASKDEAPKTILVPAADTPVALQSGPRTGRIASKTSSIISGVRAFFSGKSVESVDEPAGLSVVKRSVGRSLTTLGSGTSSPYGSVASASELEPFDADRTLRPESGGAVAPPAAPDPGKDGKKGKGWLGLGAIVAALIGGMLVMQLGLEAQGAAMAQLTEDSFGDFSILAQVAIFASIGSMIGSQLSQFFGATFGLTKTFYAAHVLRAVSLGAMVFLLGTGMMPLSLMFVFYAVNGVVTGIAVTAEGTLRKFLLSAQGVSQEKFRTWWQLLAEIVAVPAPMVLGALVVGLGAVWITALYPATILMGLMLFLMLKVIPWNAARRIESFVAHAVPASAAAVDAPKVGAWRKIVNAFKQIFANMEEGKDFVLKTPFLKYSLMGAAIFDLMNLLIYRLIAPGYGKLVAGSAGMAAVQGNIVGMFSLGGLLLAATFLLLGKRAKARDQGHGEDERAGHERSSLLRWTLWGAPALALLGVMAFQFALPLAPVMFLGVNWLPSTALAAALVPFGFFQVAASIKLNSYFVEKLPADAAKVSKAIAFSGSAMTALSIVLMLALKPLFGDLSAFNPFPWLAAVLVPVGAAVFFIQRKLAAATKPPEMRAALSAATPPTAGGYAGLLLGVMAAALVLSALPAVPGLAGLVAGLGVLGKFAAHLSVALALPAAGYFIDRAARRHRP